MKEDLPRSKLNSYLSRKHQAIDQKRQYEHAHPHLQFITLPAEKHRARRYPPDRDEQKQRNRQLPEPAARQLFLVERHNSAQRTPVLGFAGEYFHVLKRHRIAAVTIQKYSAAKQPQRRQRESHILHRVADA